MTTPGDCRSATGITVGLIDGLIATCRVLVTRDLTDSPVAEALADLRSDEDVRAVLAPLAAALGVGTDRDEGEQQ